LERYKTFHWINCFASYCRLNFKNFSLENIKVVWKIKVKVDKRHWWDDGCNRLDSKSNIYFLEDYHQRIFYYILCLTWFTFSYFARQTVNFYVGKLKSLTQKAKITRWLMFRICFKIERGTPDELLESPWCLLKSDRNRKIKSHDE